MQLSNDNANLNRPTLLKKARTLSISAPSETFGKTNKILDE
jgi:hypothetical protein